MSGKSATASVCVCQCVCVCVSSYKIRNLQKSNKANLFNSHMRIRKSTFQGLTHWKVECDDDDVGCDDNRNKLVARTHTHWGALACTLSPSLSVSHALTQTLDENFEKRAGKMQCKKIIYSKAHAHTHTHTQMRTQREPREGEWKRERDHLQLQQAQATL